MIFASSRLRVRHSVSSVSVFLSLFTIHSSLFRIQCSKFKVGCSLFFLLFLQQTSASIQLAQIDLGALPVGKTTTFNLVLPFSGETQLLTAVESSCSCLEIGKIPETLDIDEQPLKIAFTPTDSGPSEVSLTFTGLGVEDGQPFTQVIPIAVVGIATGEPAQLPAQIQSLSPEALYSKLGGYQVIDVRGSESYQKAHIPGSLEYSLDAFGTLADQFARPVVLVGDGLLSTREAALLEGLDAEEIALFWLDGGLPAWMRKGLPVQGTWPSKVDAATISLQRWLDTGGSVSDWQVVDITGQLQAQQSFFGHTVHAYDSTTNPHMEAFLQNVQEKALRNPNSRGLLVVGDERDLAYPDIEHRMKNSSAVPVYYLSCGHSALSAWLSSARNPATSDPHSYRYTSAGNALSAPGAVPLVRSGRKGGCSSCPGR